MALTTTEFQTWLESNSAIRCFLIEVVVNIGGTETTLYLSNLNYATGPSESPANTTYLPIVQNSLSFNQSIPLDGAASLSYGDISIDNTNGARDAWLDYVWANRQINIYVGDVTFTRDNFTKVYSGYTQDITSSGRNSLNLGIRDTLQRLNTAIVTTLVGGTDQNKGQLRPMIFGEVHNITPIVIDAANLIYMVHNGEIESIIEIRDNGVPLQLTTGYTVNLTNGTFTLLKAPAGVITCSVQGEKTSIDLSTGTLLTSTYTNTVAKIIGVIIRKYGLDSLATTDIDLVTFNSFNTATSAPVGIYLTSNTNVITVCQDLAKSVGSQFTSNMLGQVTLLKIDVPTGDTNTRSITDTNIILGSLSIEQKVPVQGAIKLGYCKNWTLQTQLLTGIPELHKTMLALEYLTVNNSYTDILTKYNLSSEPQERDTYIISNSPISYVTTETDRLLVLWSTPRYIYRMECTSNFLTLKLGDMVRLTHYRFGLSGGKYGQVVSISTNWDTGRVNMGVLV